MLREDLCFTLCAVGTEIIRVCGYNGYFFFIKGGVSKHDLWPPSVGNSWRTTTDIRDDWTKMIRNIDQV